MLPNNINLMKKLRYEIDLICVYCSELTIEPTMDHVLSKQDGGGHKLNNLVMCCRECNCKKKSKSLTTWRPEFDDFISMIINVNENTQRFLLAIELWFDEDDVISVTRKNGYKRHILCQRGRLNTLLCEMYSIDCFAV